MALKIKKGLTPWNTIGSDYTGIRKRALIKNGYNTALGEGDPIKVSNGYIKVAANSSAGVTGVFAGCKYIDSATKQPVESGYWTASTSSGGRLEGQVHAIGYYHDAREYTFIALADGSVSATAIGATYRVSVGTPDSLLKRSAAVVHTCANASADQYMVRIIGFPLVPGNAADTAITAVEVEIVSPRLVQG